MDKGKGNPGARPQYARDIHGLRSSNAAGTHADGRERRARTRGAAKARAVREDGC
jgi:hypothetical protein